MSDSSARLILASSSQWRAEQLQRFGLAFETWSPDVDETARPGESATDLAQRLARDKACCVAGSAPDAIVIGADQVANVDGTIVGKPGSKARAREQLGRQSGRIVVFQTGLCVCAPVFDAPQTVVETVTTRFRDLTTDEITRYVDAEDVTATAGSLKSEGLGISLAASIETRDPSALIGLPLIALRALLARAGILVP